MSREAADRYYHTVTTPDGQSYMVEGLPAEVAAEPQADGSMRLRRQDQVPADWARPVQSAQEFTEREFRLPEPGFLKLTVPEESRGVMADYGCHAWLSSQKFDKQTTESLIEVFGNHGRGQPVSFGDGLHALLLLDAGLHTPNIFRGSGVRRLTYEISEAELLRIFASQDRRRFFLGEAALPPKPASVTAESDSSKAVTPEEAPSVDQLPVTDDAAPQSSHGRAGLTETGYFDNLFRQEVRSYVRDHVAKRTGRLDHDPLPAADLATPASPAEPEEIITIPTPEPQPAPEPASEPAEAPAAAERGLVYIDELDDNAEPTVEPANDEMVLGTPRVTEYRSASRLPKELPGALDHALKQAGRLPGADIIKRHKVVAGVLAAVALLGVMKLAGNHDSAPDVTAATAFANGQQSAGTATAAWTPPAAPVALGTFDVSDKLQLSIPFTENGQIGWFPQVAPANVAQYYVSDASTWQVTANEAAPGLVSMDGSKAVVDLAKIALQYTATPMTQAEIKQQTTCTASVGGQQKTWPVQIIDSNGFVSCAAPIKVADLTQAIQAGTKMPITPAQANEINQNLSSLAANSAVNFDALNQLAVALNLDRTQLKNFTATLKQQLSKDVAAATHAPVTFINQVPSGASSYLNRLGKQQGPTTQDSLQIQGITGALTDYANATVTKQ